MIQKLDEQTKTVLYNHLSPFYGGILLHKIEEMIDTINKLSEPCVVKGSWANEPLKTIDCTGQPTHAMKVREERLQQLEKVLILRGIYTTTLEAKADEPGVLGNIMDEYEQELERLKKML